MLRSRLRGKSCCHVPSALGRGREVLRGNRNADSPTRNKDGDLVFVKPWEEQQSFTDFVDFISEQEKSAKEEVDEVRYAQTREYHVTIPFLPPFLKKYRKRQPAERIFNSFFPRRERHPLGSYSSSTRPRSH